jgi:hypothetical protein
MHHPHRINVQIRIPVRLHQEAAGPLTQHVTISQEVSRMIGVA